MQPDAKRDVAHIGTTEQVFAWILELPRVPVGRGEAERDSRSLIDGDSGNGRIFNYKTI